LGNSNPEVRETAFLKDLKKKIMKSKKSVFTIIASMLMMVICLSVNDGYSQKGTKKHDYCVMKDGKMMCMKDGKMMPMDMDMTMKNGVKVMSNGEYMDAKGNKMMLKEGEKIDMDGNMMKHGMKKMSMSKHTKMTSKTTTEQ
jgi:hypothetical protein